MHRNWGIAAAGQRGPCGSARGVCLASARSAPSRQVLALTAHTQQCRNRHILLGRKVATKLLKAVYACITWPSVGCCLRFLLQLTHWQLPRCLVLTCTSQPDTPHTEHHQPFDAGPFLLSRGSGSSSLWWAHQATVCLAALLCLHFLPRLINTMSVWRRGVVG